MRRVSPLLVVISLIYCAHSPAQVSRRADDAAVIESALSYAIHAVSKGNVLVADESRAINPIFRVS